MNANVPSKGGGIDTAETTSISLRLTNNGFFVSPPETQCFAGDEIDFV
jgi:hypothetical protein